jgi:hypothetical protein
MFAGHEKSHTSKPACVGSPSNSFDRKTCGKPFA